MLPRITIVTPSFNQARFLEQTIESVLQQGYPDLEYIVVDGGSDDGSVEILRKHAARLAHWVSEPDRGQAHAINKGFSRATGTIFGWLNSDDTLEPWSLQTVGEHFASRPDSNWLVGQCRIIDDAGNDIGLDAAHYRGRRPLLRFWDKAGTFLPQPSSFWRRAIVHGPELLRESLRYGMDYDLWIRMSLENEPTLLSQILANYRHHADTKTSSERPRFVAELVSISRPWWRSQGWGASLRNEVDWRRFEAFRYFRHAVKQPEGRLANLGKAFAHYPPIVTDLRFAKVSAKTIARAVLTPGRTPPYP